MLNGDKFIFLSFGDSEECVCSPYFFVAVLARSFVSIGVMSKNGVSFFSSSLKRIVDISVWDVDVVAIEMSSLVDATKSILCYSV